MKKIYSMSANDLYAVIRKNYDIDSYDGKEGVEEILGFTRTEEEAKLLLNKVFTITSFNEEKDDVEYLYKKITEDDIPTIEEEQYLNMYGYISYNLLNDNNDEEGNIFIRANKWSNEKCEDEIESTFYSFYSSTDVEKFEEKKTLLLSIYFQLDMIEFKKSHSKYTTGDIQDEAINKIRKIAKDWIRRNKDEIKDFKKDKIEF